MAPTKDTTDMVTFLMPDGSEVSNDPRFDMAQAREDMLAAKENTGDVGIRRHEQEAQTSAFHEAELQGNVGPDDPADLEPTLGSGRQVQKEDVKEAAETGATPPTADNPDSNEAVQAAREAHAAEQAKLAQALDDLPEEGPGDPEVPYSKWKGTQLKYEAFRRNAEREDGDDIDLSSVKKKSDLVALLEADDAAHSQG